MRRDSETERFILKMLLIIAFNFNKRERKKRVRFTCMRHDSGSALFCLRLVVAARSRLCVCVCVCRFISLYPICASPSTICVWLYQRIVYNSIVSVYFM